MWSSNLELKKVKCGISYQARLHFPGFTSQKKCYHMLLFVKKKLGKCRLDNSKSCFSELKIWTPKLSHYNKMVCRDNNLDHQSSNMQMRLFYKFSLKLFYLLEWKTSKVKNPLAYFDHFDKVRSRKVQYFDGVCLPFYS